MLAPVSRLATRAASRTQQGARSIATYSDVIPSPPTVRISFAEKCVHGLLLFTGILAFPVYAMFNVAEKRKIEYAAMEIPEKWKQWEAKQQKK